MPNHAHLLGVILDTADGHKRITTGEQFTLIGGAQETHERLTETLVKTFEDLKHRGKDLHEVEPGELGDLILKNTPAE